MLALITGASGGLGKVLSNQFWEAGFDLLVLGRNQEKLEELRDSLDHRSGQSCNVEVCDLSHGSSVEHFINHKLKKLKNINVLINNAAIHGSIGLFHENLISDVRRVFEVNFISPVALCQTVVPMMIKKRQGTIINISGGGATSPRPMFSSYGAAKTALVRFSETIASEIGGSGVTINCISPGIMATGLLKEVVDIGPLYSSDKEFELARKAIYEDAGEMNRVAKLALLLSSESGLRVNGKLISAIWDNWANWGSGLDELNSSDAYTLRRIAGRDRDLNWADK